MIPFSEYARSKFALLRAAQDVSDTTLLEKREFSKYTRIILADGDGNPYPLNITPQLRLELSWKKTNVDPEPKLLELRIIKDGETVKTIPGSHVINMSKFKHWYVQASYCYYD
jgi:hypothetical protein